MFLLHRTLLAVSLLLVASCAPRPEFVLAPEAASTGTNRMVHVATSRAAEADGRFLNRRNEGLSFLGVEVSVPPQHRAGQIEYPNAQPDPYKHFLTTRKTRLDGAPGFRQSLKRSLSRLPRNERETVVFVHGFNNTMTEGTYRTVQLVHDFKLEGVAVHYSWPSAGNPLGYGYDRDSMLFARDGLEQTLREVAKSGSQRTILVAHSMGALLTMEVLRQAPDLAKTLGGVILMSPDIDVEVFRSQAARIGDLPPPFVIFASKKDRALRLSARLTGQKERLGNLGKTDELADLNVTLVDVTEFSTGGFNHFLTGDSPALIRLLSSVRDLETAFRQDRAGRAGLLPGTVLTVQNATQVILQPLNR